MSEFWLYDDFDGAQSNQGGGDDFLSNLFTSDALQEAPSSAMSMPMDQPTNQSMNLMFPMESKMADRPMEKPFMAGGMGQSPGNQAMDMTINPSMELGNSNINPGQNQSQNQSQNESQNQMNPSQLNQNPNQMNPGQMNPGQMNPGQMNPSQMNQMNPGQLGRNSGLNSRPNQGLAGQAGSGSGQINMQFQQPQNQSSPMNLNVPMASQQSMMNNFSNQMRMPQGGQQTSLDTSKKEQLSRMRQQIMQQQMLQAQKQKQQQQQQQQQQQPMNTSASAQAQARAQAQAQAQAQARLKNMEVEATQQRGGLMTQQFSPSMGKPPGSGMEQNNRQFQNQNQNQNMDQFYRQPQNFNFQQQNPGQNSQNPQTHTPQQAHGTPTMLQQKQQQPQPPQPQQQQPQQPQPPQPQQQQPPAGQGKMPPAQVAQLQIELFMAILNDFMNRRGSPIREPIVVNRKRVNLFFLYVLSQKLGGVQVMIKSLQQPQQPSPWSVLAQRLNLYEGVDSPAARASIDKELSSCYVQYVLPYEQYCNTPDGQKDIRERRIHYQKQLVAKLQRQKQPPQNQPQNQPAQQPAQQLQQVPQQPPQMVNQKAMSPALNQMNQMSPPTVSPALQSKPAPTPTQNFVPGQSFPPESVSSAPTPRQRQQSRASTSSHNSPQVQSPYVQQNQSRASSVVQSTQRSVSQSKPTTTANMIKNYIPYRASADTQAGHDIVTLSTLGQDIDMAKPVFLFAPELGAINLHALTMSLKAMTSPYSDEVTNALNTLLVVSSDAALSIKLPECPELLDALCTVGSNLVDCIVRQTPKMAPCKVVAEPAGAIDAVFERYVKPECQDEDIAFFVDSLTGQVVQDSDLDLDDDLFSEANPSTAESSPDTSEKETREFHLDDYMSALRGFKDENRHHFSKQQTRSATNDQIMMVDQLVSVLMILRSLSVLDVNKPIATSNVLFKNLIMQTVMAVGEHGDKFVFHRKRLSLLKDCLLMLQNVALEIHLASMEEAFTALALVFSFGAAPTPDLDIPVAPLDTYTYLPFAVDVLTKLLVQEPQNRSLMQAVLTGTLTAPMGVSRQDHEKTTALATTYLGDEHKLRQGQLLTHAFRLLMSVFPYEKSAPELTKAIFSSAPTMSQALFGVKLVLDSVPTEDDTGLSDLSTRWLIANKFRILSNLGRSAVAMIGEAAKLQRGSSEHRIVTTIVQQVLLVVNTLLAHALTTRDNLLQTNKESTLIGEIDDLVNIVRVAPDPLFAMETVLATLVDGALSREVVRLLAVLGKLEKR